MDYWIYNQLSMFIKSLSKPLRTLAEISPVEDILATTQPPQKSILQFYKALLSLEHNTCPKFITKWEEDLQKPLTDTNCSKILQLAHTSSISSKIAETDYKILTGWHCTTVSLHRAFPGTTELCWIGCVATATNAHIWC